MSPQRRPVGDDPSKAAEPAPPSRVPPAHRRGDHPDQGVYVISVAAELAGVHPQTLRLYERRGLLEPARTVGGARRYSQNDIDRLHRISDLADYGLNLAGIELVLRLQEETAQLRAQVADLQTRLKRADGTSTRRRRVHPPASHAKRSK